MILSVKEYSWSERECFRTYSESEVCSWIDLFNPREPNLGGMYQLNEAYQEIVGKSVCDFG